MPINDVKLSSVLDIVVIGGGPTADASLYGLKNSNIKILQIARGVLNNPRSFRFKKTYKKQPWKFSGGEEYDVTMSPYSYNSDIIQVDLPVKGGLARHWGGGVAIPSSEDLGIPKSVHREVCMEADMLAKKFDFMSVDKVVTDLKLGKLSKAILSEASPYNSQMATSCTFCGLCNIKCPINVFYSGYQLAERLEFFKKIDAEALKIEKFDKGWKVYTSIGSVIFTKKIVLCAGALNTEKILRNSNLIDRKRYKSYFKHNDAVVFFGINFKRNVFRQPVGQSGGVYSVLNNKMYFSITSGCHVPHSDIVQMFGQNLVSKFLRRMRFHWSAGLLFFPSDISTILGSHTSMWSHKVHRWLGAFYLFFSLFRKSLLPVAFMPLKKGYDLHFGGNLPITDSTDIPGVTGECELVGCKGIFIADASILPKIPALPTTFFLMANAIRIARNINIHD